MGLLMLLCAACAAPQLPLVFLSADDLTKPAGVRVETRAPEPGITLFRTDTNQPTLWTMPIAALTDGECTRIWYQRVNKAEKEYADQRTLCVGKLRGNSWTLPALETAAPAWGGPNNICLRRSPHKPTWGGFNVFQIVRDAGTYNLLYWDQPEPPKEAGAMLATSPDGLHWTKEGRETVFTEHNDAYSLLRKDDSYLLFQTALEPWPDKPYPDNIDKFKRVLCIRSSTDLTSWTPQEIFLRPDQQDAPETEFYLLKVFAYGQGYAGLLMKYYADPKLPNKHSAILKYELMVSRDARTWKRPYRETDLGFWSYADPFVNEGRTHFAVWKDNEMKTVSYGLHALTGVVADANGEFTSEPFVMPAQGVALNADARAGNIEIQLLDEFGKSVRGARKMSVAKMEGTSLPLHLTPKTLARVAGKSCTLRIKLNHATIYAVEAGPEHPAHSGK